MRHHLRVLCVAASILFGGSACFGVLSPGFAQAEDSPVSTTEDTANETAKAGKPFPDSCFSEPGREISAAYLTRTAECLYGSEATKPDLPRFALIQDIKIKASSYAFLNKITFWLAIALAVSLLVWPSFVAIMAAADSKPGDKQDASGQARPKRLQWLQRPAATSAIQTSIAALAALSFAFYSHYKGNQVAAESLLRQIVLVETLDETKKTEIFQIIAEMDKGFSFSDVSVLK